jgi:hypothetical protein
MQNITSEKMPDYISIYEGGAKKIYSLSKYVEPPAKTNNAYKHSKNVHGAQSGGQSGGSDIDSMRSAELKLRNKIFSGTKTYSKKQGSMIVDRSSSEQQTGGGCNTDASPKSPLEETDPLSIGGVGAVAAMPSDKKVIDLSSSSPSNQPEQTGGGDNSSSSSSASSDLHQMGGKKKTTKYDTDNNLEKKAQMNLFISSRFEKYAMNGGYKAIGGKGEGLAIHREFISYIQKVLGVKGGVILQKLGSIYKKMAKKEFPNETNSQKVTDEAKKMFDKDGKGGALKKYEEIVKQMTKDKAEKKKNKASKKAQPEPETDSDE